MGGGREKAEAARRAGRRLGRFRSREAAVGLPLRRAAQAPVLPHQVSAEACFPLRAGPGARRDAHPRRSRSEEASDLPSDSAPAGSPPAHHFPVHLSLPPLPLAALPLFRAWQPQPLPALPHLGLQP